MTNIESLYTYTSGLYEGIDHLLTMGVGAHLAAVFFFAVMSQFVSPRYRAATALSGVVMVSAGLILFSQTGLWEAGFRWDAAAGVYQPTDYTFSNGYRYVNWMVTIPCLLTQLLIVLNIRGRQLVADATYLIATAWGMIITGYVGQLYEVTSLSNLLIYGAISTVFFVAMNWRVGTRIHQGMVTMPAGAARTMKRVFWLMMVAWALYPLAYLVPWMAPSAEGVLLRQALFTVADISSKVVYGIMITYVALKRSAAEGYEPASRVLSQLQSTGPAVA